MPAPDPATFWHDILDPRTSPACLPSPDARFARGLLFGLAVIVPVFWLPAVAVIGWVL